MRERNLRDDAAALADGNDLIRRHVLQRFRLSARPSDLEAVDDGGTAQANVYARVVLTQITRSRCHLAHLRASAGSEAKSRADCITIARRSNEPDQQRVAAV